MHNHILENPIHSVLTTCTGITLTSSVQPFSPPAAQGSGAQTSSCPSLKPDPKQRRYQYRWDTPTEPKRGLNGRGLPHSMKKAWGSFHSHGVFSGGVSELIAPWFALPVKVATGRQCESQNGDRMETGTVSGCERPRGGLLPSLSSSVSSARRSPAPPTMHLPEATDCTSMHHHGSKVPPTSRPPPIHLSIVHHYPNHAHPLINCLTLLDLHHYSVLINVIGSLISFLQLFCLSFSPRLQ